jgi:hypothetical protein
LVFSGGGGDNGAAGSGTLQLSVAVRPSVKVTAAVKSCVADQVRPSKALNVAEGHGLAVAPLLGVAPCGLLLLVVTRVHVLDCRATPDVV